MGRIGIGKRKYILFYIARKLKISEALSIFREPVARFYLFVVTIRRIKFLLYSRYKDEQGKNVTRRFFAPTKSGGEIEWVTFRKIRSFG